MGLGTVQSSRIVTHALCCCALALEVFNTWLTNAVLYPRYVAVFPEARDISSIVSVIAFAVLAVIAMKAPRVICESRFTSGALIAFVVGFSLVIVGLATGNAAILLVGACIRSVSTRWFVALVGLSLCTLKAREGMLCIAAAFCLAYAFRACAAGLSPEAALCIAFALPFAQCAMTRGTARPIIERMRKSTPAADAAITQPLTILPLAHALFLAIFIYRFAYGFALKFSAENGMPSYTILSAIPVLIIMGMAFAVKKNRADSLYAVSVLLIIAGFLFVSTFGTLEGSVAVVSSNLIYAGSECFDALAWYVLARLGARNEVNALWFIAWSRATASAGLLVGTVVGGLMNAADGTFAGSTGAAMMVFVFVALNLTVLKQFSFEETIEGVQPTWTVSDSGASGETSLNGNGVTEGFKARCELVARKSHLTPRETEIFMMLARGRNVPFIQEKLVLSRNTVKTHVSNIYGKLGVHSQQDLIDMIEEEPK